jgi:hypothetical protein
MGPKHSESGMPISVVGKRATPVIRAIMDKGKRQREGE